MKYLQTYKIFEGKASQKKIIKDLIAHNIDFEVLKQNLIAQHTIHEEDGTSDEIKSELFDEIKSELELPSHNDSILKEIIDELY